MCAAVMPGPSSELVIAPKPLVSAGTATSRRWKTCWSRDQVQSALHPATVVAYLAVLWRIVLAPVLLITFVLKTDYLTTAAVFIGADEAYFAFSFRDAVMIGACNNCDLGCARALAILSGFEHQALISRPEYETLFTTTADLTAQGLVNHELSAEELALANVLDGGGDTSYCFSGVSEWGASILTIHGSARQIRDVIQTLRLSVDPRHLIELERAIADTSSECSSGRWDLLAFPHAYSLIPTSGVSKAETATIAAATMNVFPEMIGCRPHVSREEDMASTSMQLALDTGGEDIALRIPHEFQSYPFSFDSSLPPVSAGVLTSDEEGAIVQPHFQAYYGRCRVRKISTVGIFVEADCSVDAHWANYGVMLLQPDNINVCNTAAACVHNWYNPLWEYVSSIEYSQGGAASSTNPRRFLIAANVFRLRSGDNVALSALPGIVVLQVLLMGTISLCETMAHRRSVLLTQIWAYRCQIGYQQVVYLAQVAYHLFSTSDHYYLGLATGTLSLESLANLTFCFFVFSYTLINLLRARTGEQQLDRYFRLTWEILQLGTTALVATSLYYFRHTSLDYIVTYNGELLRKTMERSTELCGLNDSCIVFSVNLVVVLTVVVALLGLIPLAVACFLRRWLRLQVYRNSDEVDDRLFTLRRQLSSAIRRYRGMIPGDRISSRTNTFFRRPESRTSSVTPVTSSPPVDSLVASTVDIDQPLTSFERQCLGTNFSALFHDCEDFAYVMRRGERFSSVEAVLLSGYLFYGAHIYRASDLILLLLARVLPDWLLRSFNILLMRWRVDIYYRTISYPIASMWYAVGSERGKRARVAPIR